MKEPILQGSDSAIRHLKSINDYVAGLGDQERAQWWAGFLAASFGCACASVGPNHAQTLMDSIKLIAPDVTTAMSN